MSMQGTSRNMSRKQDLPMRLHTILAPMNSRIHQTPGVKEGGWNTYNMFPDLSCRTA